ncbi:Integral peroxisomal membrane peroxin, partial [Rhizoctonia solani]
MSQRNSLIVSEPMSSSSFPTLPSASHEPVPEAQQHLAARHKRRISLRPHRLSVHGSKSNDDSLRSNRRRGVDLNIVELDAEPEPDCVINTDVRVENGSQSQDDDESKDLYEWAILYENQRGITLFSIPYYSKLSLLPNDPPPFTVPNEATGHGRVASRQRTTLRATGALSDYQLPDPTWRWVSKFWMVDMRGDGEVQQDGYEYNWCFRSKGWRASIGSFNAGGWVRRRRWVRLMMRPANAGSPLRSSTFEVESTSPSSTDPIPTPGSTTTINESEKNEKGDALIWRGDEDDWSRVRDALRNFRSDGRRLEAWERWLALEEQALLVRATERLGIGVGNGIKLRMDDWDLRHAIDPASPISRDTTPGTLHIRAPVPSKDVVLPVLRENLQRILSTFIFPDSRAQFLELLRLAGYNEHLIPQLSTFDSHSDFWSLARSVTPQSQSPGKSTKRLSSIADTH